MAVFDTLRATRTLKAAGFGDAQAEAVAEIVQVAANGNRVTKVDMQGFATKADLERFATKADLERFATKAEIQDLELRLTIRLGVVAAASVTLTTALVVGLNQLLL